jgi:hypothetical protein
MACNEFLQSYHKSLESALAQNFPDLGSYFQTQSSGDVEAQSMDL